MHLKYYTVLYGAWVGLEVEDFPQVIAGFPPQALQSFELNVAVWVLHIILLTFIMSFHYVFSIIYHVSNLGNRPT